MVAHKPKGFNVFVLTVRVKLTTIITIMKRKIAFCVFLSLLLSAQAVWAQKVTVYLKNGRKIEGQLMSQDNVRVRVSVDGIPYTYYRDEVEKIDDGTVKAPTGPVSLDKLVDKSLRQAENIPQAKRDLIVRFMNVNGTRDSIARIFSQIIRDVPPESAQTFNEIFKVDEVLLRLLPVYDKYYTEDELREMINFYSTPTANKMIRITPTIMQEVMNVSAAYFQERIPENPPAAGSNRPKK